MVRNDLWSKAFKRAAVLITAGALVLGMAACGGKSGQSPSGGQGASDSQASSGGSVQTETGGDAGEQADQQEGISYPLQTDDTLTIWHNNQLCYGTIYSGYEESPFHVGLAERTGVKLEWSNPIPMVYGTRDDQAYTLLLTEETLPDIIFTPVDATEAEQLIADGVIYDLTEYLPLYAPDYWAYISAPENIDYWRELQTESGKFYNVACITEDFSVNTYQGPIIRQDWLDECGLDAPVTLDDWEKVITAFVEKYDAPFGYWQASMDNAGLGSGVGAYGNFAACLYLDDNGKVQLGQAQPEWKEYMEVLHDWWDKGLIDKDSLSMDDAAVRQKVLNNQIGITYSLGSRINVWMSDAAEIGSPADWLPLAYPRTAPGEPTNFVQCADLCRGGSRYNGWGAMVTTSCPEDRLITALEFLNYGFCEEGILYWNYGMEGVSYTMGEDGLPVWTDLLRNDERGLQQAAQDYTGSYGAGICIRKTHSIESRGEGNGAAYFSTWSENTENAKHRIPNISLTDEESLIYSDLYTAINTRTKEMALKFMTGEESLDHFDSFVEELNNMGLQDLLDVTQTAYDRYLEK